jgi:glucan phosphoethanolaminetransferase (alkaline phosphatase superfamily)
VSEVKLFRVTEFAESVFQSPLAHRTAVHPLWVMLFLAAWMTVLGHVPLWRTLWSAVVQGQASAPWLAGVVVQVYLLSLALVALVHWPGAFKWGAAGLLLWSGLGAAAMALRLAAGEGAALSPMALAGWLLNPAHALQLLNWNSGLQLLVIAALPIVLLARLRVRRLPMVSILFLNGALLALAGGLLALMGPWSAHTIGTPLDWR